jgi:DNA polymerase-3 subunit epsilon
MKYLVLDLELTGPDVGYHDIIQIGAVLCDAHWNEQSHFLSNVYPENPEAFSQRSEEVHGLSIYDLEDAPARYEVLEAFEHWVRQTLGRNEYASLKDVLLCGQGILTDVNFLKWAFEEENIEWPFSYKVLDLMSFSFLMYKILKNNGKKVPKSHSLDAVAAMFDLSRDTEEHNALEDARLTAACFKAYWEIADQLKLHED